MAYGFTMMDVMAVLRDRRIKAEAKVARAIKALESAKKELTDVVAAERVMAEITGESPEPRPASLAISDRDKEITKLLATNASEASSPAELHLAYVNATGDSINLDVFRTALWRLQKKAVQGLDRQWTIKSENGRYWREATGEPHDEFEQLLGGESEDEP